MSNPESQSNPMYSAAYDAIFNLPANSWKLAKGGEYRLLVAAPHHATEMARNITAAFEDEGVRPLRVLNQQRSVSVAIDTASYTALSQRGLINVRKAEPLTNYGREPHPTYKPVATPPPSRIIGCPTKVSRGGWLVEPLKTYTPERLSPELYTKLENLLREGHHTMQIGALQRLDTVPLPELLPPTEKKKMGFREWMSQPAFRRSQPKDVNAEELALDADRQIIRKEFDTVANALKSQEFNILCELMPKLPQLKLRFDASDEVPEDGAKKHFTHAILAKKFMGELRAAAGYDGSDPHSDVDWRSLADRIQEAGRNDAENDPLAGMSMDISRAQPREKVVRALHKMAEIRDTRLALENELRTTLGDEVMNVTVGRDRTA